MGASNSTLMLALFINVVVLASYLAFYTAYSKKTKKLEAADLIAVLTLSEGLDHTLVQMNKAISLNGLTVLVMAFLPGLDNYRYDLVWYAMLQLWVHSAYSAWKYYGSNNIPLLSTWGNIGTELSSTEAKDKLMAVKKISIVLGSLGQVILSAGYLRYVAGALFCYGAVGLGVAHFVSMEVDFRWKLQVRPYAYLPFPLA